MECLRRQHGIIIPPLQCSAPVKCRSCYDTASGTQFLRRKHEIIIPPLQCSAPLKCHPCYESIREEADAWALSRFYPATSDLQNNKGRLLVQSQFPFLAATSNATAEKGRCVSVSKFFAWLFAFDDINDDLMNGVGMNGCAADELFQCLLDALVGAMQTHSSPVPPSPQHRVVDVALDWWREIWPAMSATQQSRFLQGLRDSLAACRAQISYRQADSIPDVQTYILRRREASGFPMIFVILEYSLGIELDEEALSHNLLLEIQNAVIDHVSWINDLLSMKSEYSRGEFDNLTSTICFNESHNVFQISVEKVCKMIAERDNDFVRLLNEVRKSSLMEKPGMEAYLDGLASWMSANLHWSYATARYHGVDALESRPVDAPLSLLLHPAPENHVPLSTHQLADHETLIAY